MAGSTFEIENTAPGGIALRAIGASRQVAEPGGTGIEARGGLGSTGGASITGIGGSGQRGGPGIYSLGGQGLGLSAVGGAGAILAGGNGQEAGPGLVAEAGVGPAPSDAIIAIGDINAVGVLAGRSVEFRIGHPISAARGTLSHSAVFSPDMKTVYDGMVTLDGQGAATVSLPDWFEALNEQYRYQLTSVGGPAPQLHIASKITNNQFRIAGGVPGAEVSWQVTGIRRDTFAQQNRIRVESTETSDVRRWLDRSDRRSGGN